MKYEVKQFVEEMLRWIRREFFAKCDAKHFYQERPMLIQAITWPAEWMNRRGAKLPASGYKRILGTVIQTIKRHGEQVKFRRFSLYFFKAVQEHMNHHGDEYYQAAKCRSLDALLPAATRHVRTGRAVDSVTETLAQMNRVLRSPGGRRRAIQSGSEADLFSSCKPRAARMQNRGNHSQTFAVLAENAPEVLNPQIAPVPASLGTAGDS